MANKIIDIEGLDAFLQECVVHFISKKTLETVNELLLEIPEEALWFDTSKLTSE